MENDEKDRRIKELEAKVAELEAKAAVQSNVPSDASAAAAATIQPVEHVDKSEPWLSELPTIHQLSPSQIERYSRQMILTASGLGSVEGQKRLLSSSVLLVGAGGIGSSAILYLAAAGVGRLGIVDFDRVETTNLHRQVIHTSDRVGWNKAVSACLTVQKLNPTVDCVAYPSMVDHKNVLQLLSAYDCIVDCSDNPQTRYLINDACVLSGKPLVSGSAVGTEGQLTIYNSKNGGPCYRCLYPRPSATAGCRACADAGVLGTVPGLIGILQATEVLKLLTATEGTMDQRMLMYDALAGSFLTIKKPPKQPKCPVCGPNATIRSMEESQESLLTTHGPQRQRVPFSELPDSLQISCQSYHDQMFATKKPHILLDVRVQAQYNLCSLPGSIHIPLADLMARLDDVIDNQLVSSGKEPMPVYCICRRGIDSVEAVRLLHEARPSHPKLGSVYNVKGGLNGWRDSVDPSFPKY